ncbi:hypothetical protein D3C84_1145260 [compost metagenome]
MPRAISCRVPVLTVISVVASPPVATLLGVASQSANSVIVGGVAVGVDVQFRVCFCQSI